jgi:tripartite ATP-independent transporter DctM subunit
LISPSRQNEEAVPANTFGWLDTAVDIVLGAALLAELAVVFGNVIARAIFRVSYSGTIEVSSFALAVLAFIGGATAYRRGQHMAVVAVVQRLPRNWSLVLAALVDWLIFAIAVVVGISSIQILKTGWNEWTPTLGVRVMWFRLPVTVGMALLAFYASLRLWQRQSRTVIFSGVGLLTLGLLMVLSRSIWIPWMQGSAVLWPTLGSVIILLVIGVPVGFVLALGAFVYTYISGVTPLLTLALNMQRGIEQFVLLALPFFILAGLIMDKGGIGARIVEFLHALIGHFRGGLLQVLIVGMYIVSGISGSKAADMAAIGMPMNRMLRKAGYDPGESVAVLATADAMGESVPPSIAILILGSVTTLSIGALFLAGLMPAATIAACLMLLVYARARFAGKPPGARAKWRDVGRATLRALISLLMPIILIGGIVGGIGTPTEVSSFAVVYGLILAILLYREMDLRSLWGSVVESASMAGMILFIVSTATVFSWALTVATLPQQIAASMSGLAPWVFLLFTVFFVAVMGALLEGIAALLILAPLLLPVAIQLGVNPLQYGIILIESMGFGAFAPPIGIGLYIACAIGQTTMEDTLRPMLAYMAVLLLGLLLVTFIPWLTLVVPHAFHLGN